METSASMGGTLGPDESGCGDGAEHRWKTRLPLGRDVFVNHILMMKQTQPDYAREALKAYDKAMPWLDLMQGVRQALEQQ